MSRKSILTAFLLVTALLLVLFFWRGGHWLVVETPLKEADAVVMLRGSSPDRELEVASLYHKNLAGEILFAHFSTHNIRLMDSLGVDLPRGVEGVITVLQHLILHHEPVSPAPEEQHEEQCCYKQEGGEDGFATHGKC